MMDALIDATIPKAEPRSWTELAEAIDRGEHPALSELRAALLKHLPPGMGKYLINRLTNAPPGQPAKNPRVEVPKKTNEALRLAWEVVREQVLLRRAGVKHARGRAEETVAKRRNMTGETLRTKIRDGRKEFKRRGLTWPTLASLRGPLKEVPAETMSAIEDVVLRYALEPQSRKMLEDAGISIP
jgi:hypothetical protein